MTTCAVVDQSTGLIVNRIVLDDPSSWPTPDGHSVVEEIEPMDIGGTYVDGFYTPPYFEPPEVLPDPVPATISRRQFYQQLALTETITKQEALDAIRVGAIPATIQVMLDAIPDADDRFNAEMLLSGAAEIQRDHPLTAQIGAAQGMTESQIDAFFRGAVGL